jgi:hypothetical protein
VTYVQDEQDVPTQTYLSDVFAVDFDVMRRAAGGLNGVISGGAVTQAGTPSMNVPVVAATNAVDGTQVTVAGQTVSLDDAHATLPRWDLVYVNAAGTATKLTGTAATSPHPPQLPASCVAHARIYVPAGDTAITNAQIVDLRVFVPVPSGAAGGWTVLKATDETTGGTRSNTAALAKDSQLKIPLAANTKYAYRWHLEFDAKAASDLKLGIDGPASPTRVRVVSRRLVGPLGFDLTEHVRFLTGYDTTGLVQGQSSDGLCVYEVTGTITCGSTAGDFGPTWAQGTAVAENTVRLNGSWLEYQAV